MKGKENVIMLKTSLKKKLESRNANIYEIEDMDSMKNSHVI